MTIVQNTSTHELALQNAGTDVTTTGQTHYLNETITVGSRSATCYIRVTEQDSEPGVGPFYYSYDLVSGTQYGYSIATGTSAKVPIADTNPLTGSFTNSATTGYTQDFGYDEWESVASDDYLAEESTRSSAGGWDYGGGNGTLGSMTNATSSGKSVTLGNGSTYTINMIAWQKNSASGPKAADDTANRGNYLALGISSTTGESTSMFHEITVNGVTFTRSSRKQFDGYENGGGAFWRWEPTDAQIDSMNNNSGTVNVKISSTSSTQTFTNGIAEEFGGADSSNVTLSHYYKGAPEGYVVDGTGTSGIPSDGSVNLSFSDFYGASYVAPEIALLVNPGLYTSTANYVYGYSTGQTTNSTINPGSSNLGTIVSSSVPSNFISSPTSTWSHALFKEGVYYYSQQTDEWLLRATASSTISNPGTSVWNYVRWDDNNASGHEHTVGRSGGLATFSFANGGSGSSYYACWKWSRAGSSTSTYNPFTSDSSGTGTALNTNVKILIYS